MNIASILIFKRHFPLKVCGVIILGVSLWMYTNDDIKKYLTIIEYDRSNPYFDAALIVLILVGVFIFLVGFLGCCGAWKENSCLLWLVSISLKYNVVILWLLKERNSKCIDITLSFSPASHHKYTQSVADTFGDTQSLCPGSYSF